jgi:hypothetical protein
VNFREPGLPSTADILLFDRDGLTAAGFAGWESVAQLGSQIAQVPLSAGTYVVLGPGGTPKVLPVNRGGRFKGNDPTVAVAVLEARLLANTQLLYVGQGGSLRKRIKQLIQFAAGKPVGHWGGRCLWQLANSNEFLVAWRVETNAREAEAKLLARFEGRYGRLPFANWQR